jgi:hypothetical protein
MKVTREDLARYASKYINGKPYVAGLIINQEMNKSLKPGDYFKSKDF